MKITKKSLTSLSAVASAAMLVAFFAVLPGARAQDVEPVPEDVVQAAGAAGKAEEEKPKKTAVDELEALFGALDGAAAAAPAAEAAVEEAAAAPAAEAAAEPAVEAAAEEAAAAPAAGRGRDGRWRGLP